MRSRIADGLDRTRLLGPAERLREGWLTLCAQDEVTTTADGLLLPPPRLRLLVEGRTSDTDSFLWLGSQMCDSIQAAVAAAGAPVEQMRAILDFGCGCGRVARHWAAVEGPEVYGCDYNPELLAWCAENLPHMRTARNELAPPTPYVSGSFDLIYAFSVFTHLDEGLQSDWLAEFRRLLRPGGILILSVLSDRVRYRLDRGEQQRFDRGEMIVRRPRMSGRNLCTVYHPAPYVTGTLLADFAEVRHFDLGSPERPIHQDAYLARV